MKKIRLRGVFLFGLTLLSGAAVADVHTWVGGNSTGGGWNVAANWTNPSGENEVPGEGDTALINTFVTNVVTDADLPVFNALARVKMNYTDWSTKWCVLVLDTTQNPIDVKPSINGSGRFIKRGSNRANFVSVNEDGASSPYSRYGVYALNGGGIFVEGGTLSLIQTTAREYIYDVLTIAAGATVCVPTNGPVTVSGLSGAGTVVNEDTRANPTARTLSIDYFTNYHTSDFAGKITGPIKLTVNGRQTFRGAESDFTGDFNVQYTSDYTKKYGWAFVKKFGMKGEPSSVGVGSTLYLFFGGNLGYIGDGTPETTDRGITTEARASAGLGTQWFDAGTNGNLTITGTINLAPYGSEYNMRSFVFGGSNAAPCTVAGPFCLNMTSDRGTDIGHEYNFYVRKEGPGVWAFQENANTTFKGVFDVREGTLRFDSMAAKGSLSALGFSTNLTEEYFGKFDPKYDSRYAFRVGTTSATAAPAVFEFNGAKAGVSTDRPLLLTGNATIRANGTTDAAQFRFGDVSAASGATTLTLDGTNTAENVLLDLDDGDGTVSLVKDGVGTWNLSGDQTFTGNLTVKAGTLVVNGPKPFTWFRFVMTDGYGNPYGGYVNEIALYDEDGNRRNLDLTFTVPDGASWDKGWNTTEQDVLKLPAGSIGFSTPGTYYWMYSGRPVTNACDGTSSAVQFATAFGGGSRNTVAMHLTNGTEIVAVDFEQENGHYGMEEGYYQTPSAFYLEGSIDGQNWKTLVTQTNLVHRDSAYWYYSTDNQKISETGRANRKLSDGQGLAFMSAAREDATTVLPTLANATVTVAAGSVLKTDGNVSPTIAKLAIDGQTGAGTISGFTFAENMTVDIIGLEKFRGSSKILPLDFTGVENFDSVKNWTFKQDGSTSTRYSFKMTKTGLRIYKSGFVISIL